MIYKNLLIYLLYKYPNKRWDWNELLCNPNMTIETIEKLDILYKFKNKYWYFISKNPNITIDFIEKFLDKEWSFHWL